MQHRPLGQTGLPVSEIGFGAWGIGGSGWIGAQEDESVRALHRAIELGVNFIDTARGYGESERIVGQVVREHRGDPLYVATKVPPRNRIWPAPDGVDPAETFPGDHIRASLETSLRVSGLEAFDLLQFHVWSDEWMGRGDWLETIGDLKREGKIRFFGVSVNDYQPDNALELVRSGHVDAVQVIYNAFHQAPEEHLLPACARARRRRHRPGRAGRGRPDRPDHPRHQRFPPGTSATATSAVTGRRRSSSTSTPWSPTSASNRTSSPRSRCATCSARTPSPP